MVRKNKSTESRIQELFQLSHILQEKRTRARNKMKCNDRYWIRGCVFAREKCKISRHSAVKKFEHLDKKSSGKKTKFLY